MTVPAVVKPMKARVKPLLKRHQVGRPTKYDKTFPERAERLALSGYTDVELASFLGIGETTLNVWKQRYTEFRLALQRGKDASDTEIEASLRQRAIGYSHPAVKIFADPKTGAKHVVKYTERYPPDTGACKMWLTNRQPGRWRERR